MKSYENTLIKIIIWGYIMLEFSYRKIEFYRAICMGKAEDFCCPPPFSPACLSDRQVPQDYGERRGGQNS